MTNKKKVCSKCGSTHTLKGESCSPCKKKQTDFRNSWLMHHFVNAVEKAGNTAVLPTTTEEIIALLDLLSFQRKSHWWSGGKRIATYDLAHLIVGSPINGYAGTFTADNLILTPSDINRSLGDTDFNLPYGRKVKLHSRDSVRGKNKKLVSKGEIKDKIIKKLGKNLIRAIEQLTPKYPKLLKGYKPRVKKDSVFPFESDGLPPATVLIHELLRLSNTYPEIAEVEDNAGFIQSGMTSRVPKEVESIYTSILTGNLNEYSDWWPIEVTVVTAISNKYFEVKLVRMMITDEGVTSLVSKSTDYSRYGLVF